MHSKMHWPEIRNNPVVYNKLKKGLKKAVKAAVAVNRARPKSYYVKLGKMGSDSIPWVDSVCIVCGKTHQTKFPKRARYCSNACCAKGRRMSGADNIKRFCLRCGSKYMASKYDQRKYCSRKCNPGRGKSIATRK